MTTHRKDREGGAEGPATSGGLRRATGEGKGIRCRERQTTWDPKTSCIGMPGQAMPSQNLTVDTFIGHLLCVQSCSRMAVQQGMWTKVPALLEHAF